MQEQLDSIWEDAFLDKARNFSRNEVLVSDICKHLDLENFTCKDCGLILDSQQEFCEFNFEVPVETKVYSSKSFNRIAQLNEWISWSAEEKKEYKIKKYTRELCERMSIYPNIIDSVIGLVLKVNHLISSRSEGSKRSNIKDAIIIRCVEMIDSYNSIELAKRINLDPSYLSKADRVLINLGIVKQTIDPPRNLDNKLKMLIEICEDNQLFNTKNKRATEMICMKYLDPKLKLDSKYEKDLAKLTSLSEKIDKMLNEN